MCGRFGLEYGQDFYPRFLLKNQLPSLATNLNISPGQQVAVVLKKDGENVLQRMKWGLIPFWAKDQKIGQKLFNARIETVSEKPSFRESFYKRRCIVPASIFYEWQDFDGKKIPYGFQLHDKKYFTMASIYDVWKDPNGISVSTFTILTTQPNSIVSPIHNRMPVILDQQEEQQWLDLSTSPDRLYKIALSTMKDELVAIKI